MCNICSLFSPQPIQADLRDLVFDTQIIASTKHGDGFGYFVPESSHGEASTYYKTDMPAYLAAYLTSSESSLGRRFLFTHTRKASSGKVVLPGKNDEPAWAEYTKKQKSYAHPFVMSKVIVLHNGTLSPEKEHILECEMDSQFFAEKLNEAYDPKKENYVEALKAAFGFFENGIYSMMIAFRNGNTWKPMVLKGTKPLDIFKCTQCGAVIYVTDDTFFKFQALILEAKSTHKFEVMPAITPGLYDPFSGECIHKGLFIDEKVWASAVTYDYTRRTGTTGGTNRNVVQGTTGGDNASPEIRLRNIYRKLGTLKYGRALYKFLDALDKAGMEAILSMPSKEFVDNLETAFTEV